MVFASTLALDIMLSKSNTSCHSCAFNREAELIENRKARIKKSSPSGGIHQGRLVHPRGASGDFDNVSEGNLDRRGRAVLCRRLPLHGRTLHGMVRPG